MSSFDNSGVQLGAGVAVLGACLLLFFVNLGSAPLNTKGEPRVGLQVQEQLRSGDWILPRLNGRALPSKPPLFPWLGGLTALVTGSVDEFALRFPSALMATAVVLMVFWWATRRWDATAGVCASLILATSFEWLRAARVARVDMTHTAFLVGALISFELAIAGPASNVTFIFLFYVSMGLAALTKGPVGIILPALVALTYLALRRDLGRLRHLRLAAGSAVALVLAGSWYVLALLSGGGGFLDLIYRENVLRFVRTSSHGGAHVHPFYYYVPGFLAGFLPWSPLLLPLGIHLYRSRTALQTRGYLYLLVWFAAVFLFYSASAGKRTVYILPAYPAVALLLGAWWSGLIRASPLLTPRVHRTLRAINAIGAAALIVMLLIVVASALGAQPLSLLTPLLHPRDQANLPLIQEILHDQAAVLSLSIIALLAVTAISAVALTRLSWAVVFLWLVVVSGGMATVVNAVLYPELARRQSVKSFLASVREMVPDSDDLAFYRTVDFGAAFYAGRHVEELDTLTQSGARPMYVLIWEEDWQRLGPDARDRLERLRESNPTESQGRRRLLLTRLRR